MGEIECVIMKLDLGLILVNDGNMICLFIFLFMEECRIEFVKLMKKFGEEGKVVICNICCDVNDDIKKMEKLEIFEDEFWRY